MKLLCLHITTACNSLCRYCVMNIPEHPQSPPPPPSHFSNILGRYASDGFDAVFLCGGEPTLYPELIALLNDIKIFHFPETHIISNGRKLANNNYTSRLIEAGVDRFILTLLSHDYNTHDYLTRIPGSFSQTTSGIENALKAGSKVQVNIVVTKTNYRDLDNTIEHALNLGVNDFNITGLCPIGTSIQFAPELLISNTAVMPHLSQAVDYATSNNLNISLEGFPICMLGDLKHYSIEHQNERKETLVMLDANNSQIDNYDEFLNQSTKLIPPRCSDCLIKSNCGGIYHLYYKFFQDLECQPTLRVQ